MTDGDLLGLAVHHLRKAAAEFEDVATDIDPDYAQYLLDYSEALIRFCDEVELSQEEQHNDGPNHV